ncbi:MAG: hypothetical protein JNM43_03410 [Planctomycetaceae bacterium]|nr:hypothetical protein [Planctomycetaceae bacterium]
MNILNRNRNRRKVSASRLSTSADPCETRSLLCAAALPVAELVDTPENVTEDSAQSEMAELVESSASDEFCNIEVCTFDVSGEPVDVTAYSDEAFPVDTELTEDDLARLAAGVHMMFNVFASDDGSVVSPEFTEDYQPEIAICTFGPEMQFDENGNPIEVKSEVEFDPAVYDITTLEGWDPSWAFRGVIVDGSEEVSGNIPVEEPVGESGEYTDVDWVASGLEDLDGDGIPDGLAWSNCIAEDFVNEPGFPSDFPVDGDPVNLPIYWFGVADGGTSEVDEFGNPIYYMAPGISEDGESPVDGFVDGEVKVTFDDIVEFGDSTVIDPADAGPVDENGEVIPVMYFSMGGPEMVAVQRSLDSVPEQASAPASSLPEIHHEPARLPLVRIPVMRPQFSVFQTPTGTPATPAVSSARLSPVTSSQPTTSPVESMPAVSSSRVRSFASMRSVRPSALPASNLNELSPLLETETSEEAPEDVTVPQQVDDVIPVTSEGETEQPTTRVPARERRSIDMFMSDFADDGYIG